MVVNEFWILLLGVKKEKLRIRLKKSIYASKGAFYNGNESDNDDESYNENNEH